MIDVMQALKENNIPECDIAHWQSDLYLRVTPDTQKIISEYDYKNMVTTFIDNIDHVLWYEVPFAYYGKGWRG